MGILKDKIICIKMGQFLNLFLFKNQFIIHCTGIKSRLIKNCIQ